MKGAKGGIRDRKITEAYRKKNNSSLEEELEAIKDHRKHDGLNLNKNENGIYDIETLGGPQNYSTEIKENRKLLPKEEISRKEVQIENSKTKEEQINIENLLQESFPKHKGVEIEEKEYNALNESYEINKAENDFNKEEIVNIDEEKIPIKEEKTNNKEPEELKKDAKIEKAETEIVLEFERMLKEDYYEIKDLEYKLKVLTQKEEDALLQEEVETLKKELEVLLDKFTLLKNKYEELKNAKDLNTIRIFDNDYLQNLINNYKKDVQNNIEVDDLIKRVKETEEYISIIEKVVYVEHEKDHLEKKVEDKEEEFEDRDIKFEELEKEYADVEKINKELESFNNTLNGLVKDMAHKIDHMGKIYDKTETYRRIVPDMNRIFRAMLQFAVSTRIPRTRTGNVARAALILGGLNNLAHAFVNEQRTEVIKVAEFTNYEREITENINTITQFSSKLHDTSNFLKEIKQEFKDVLGEYADSIPEFKELMNNMDQMEKELEEKQFYMDKYQNEMKKELDRNNAKALVYKNI